MGIPGGKIENNETVERMPQAGTAGGNEHRNSTV